MQIVPDGSNPPSPEPVSPLKLVGGRAAALEARGVDLDAEERTTAAEWLAAHREHPVDSVYTFVTEGPEAALDQAK